MPRTGESSNGAISAIGATMDARGFTTVPHHLTVVFRGIVRVFERWPWAGWAGWIIICVIIVGRVTARPYAATFGVYLDAANHLRAHELLYGPANPTHYDPFNISGYLYWPVSALVLVPFTYVSEYVAAASILVLSALVLSWGAVELMQALFPKGSRGIDATMAAGILLLINIPMAWYNFKSVQAQIIMTGAMLLAAAAMMRGRWRLASLWLFVAIITKPLAIVMLLICGWVFPYMRWTLAAAILAALTMPFAFFDANYLFEQYGEWLQKLYTIASVSPSAWVYQADFASMLDSFGLGLRPPTATAIRVFSAVATLTLAWRVSKTCPQVASAMAVLLLSGCYLCLFGPRNEYLSFLVLTPALTALAFLLFAADKDDLRGWALIVIVLVLGWHWSLQIDRFLKPALVCGVYLWLSWLMMASKRWQLVFDRGMQPRDVGR